MIVDFLSILIIAVSVFGCLYMISFIWRMIK